MALSDENVFINCPLDDEYLPLLKVILFILKKAGLSPRLALERHDSGEVRLGKIKELLEVSKYSIHDLSRIRAETKGEYFRFNMPFELGIDLGCRDYNSDKSFRQKKFLILEKEKYSVQKALSDLSFADCKCHNGDEEELTYQLRNWLVELGFKDIPSASSLWDEYNYFIADIYQEKKGKGFKQKDIERLPVPEFLDWINEKIKKPVAI